MLHVEKKELAKILGTVFHNQPSPQGWKGPIFKRKNSFGLQINPQNCVWLLSKDVNSNTSHKKPSKFLREILEGSTAYLATKDWDQN